MDVIDRVPEPVSPFEAMRAKPPEDERRDLDVHAEINLRRAQIENAEMLRRLRSL